MELNMANITSFTKKYQKTITLKNELIPIGETINYIDKIGFINEDEQRNEDYKKAKEIIDAFHKKFIDYVLNNVTNFSWKELQDSMVELQRSQKYKLHKNEKNYIDLKKDFDEECKTYRKRINKLFNRKENFSLKEILNGNTDERFHIPETDIEFTYKDLFQKELIKTVLPSILQGKDLEIINKFNSFTSYFKGFNDNRKNVYSEEKISTSISYRVVHDNFPKFLANIRVYNKICELKPAIIQTSQERLHKQYLNGEVNIDLILSNVFNVDFFNRTLSQSGIDLYNFIIGSLNEDINLATQSDKDLKEKLKSSNAIKLLPLFKQILSDRIKQFKVEAYQNENELITDFKEFFDNINSNETLYSIRKLFDNLSYANTQNIYVQGKNLSLLSINCTNSKNWSTLQDSIELQTLNDQNFSKKSSKKSADINSSISSSVYSLKELQEFLSKADNSDDLIKGIINTVNMMLDTASEFSNLNYPKGITSKKDKERIKNQLDGFLRLYNFVRIFDIDDPSVEKNIEFYCDYDKNLSSLNVLPALYNKIRNFATKKPYSVEKFKLNFKNPTLAKGWSKSKEPDYQTLIFLKNNKYYLGILADKKVVFDGNESFSTVNVYRKMDYILCPDAAKQIPHQCFTKHVKNHFESSTENFVLSNSKFTEDLIITKEIFDIYKNKKYYSDPKLNNNPLDLKKYINFCIKFLEINKTMSCFDFNPLKIREYTDYPSFVNDVNEIAYSIQFRNFEDSFINNLVSEGKLYLFQVYNKDFAEGTSGKKNLHTLYWESVFDQDNLKNVIYKLNGEAELFYRRLSIKENDKTVHHKNSILVNKVDKAGRTIPESIYQKLYADVNHNNNEKLTDEELEYKSKILTKVATHDITKDQRFTVNKFFFHCPITINFKAPSESNSFDEQVLNFLRNNSDINIIGVDRGERNLIYVTVVDQKGNIIFSKSFNEIETTECIGKPHSVNYQQKLQQREHERLKEKKSWESITRIATLKDGYMSYIVHEIVKLMIEYNAIVVLENLNTGFKRIRQGITEKSVYQKFEMALISKLKYLVFKTKDKNEAGGLLNGLQLCNKSSKYNDNGTQDGFIFYVPAQYTSKIDPATGFFDFIKWRSIKNQADKKQLFSSFTEIKYEKNENLFKFSIDLSKLKNSVRLQNTSYKNHWDIYTYGDRIIKKKNKNKNYSNNKDFIEIKNYSPTEEMKKLLQKNNINFLDSGNLQNVILNSQLENKFWMNYLKFLEIPCK